MNRTLPLFLALVLPAAPVHADLYRWTDANGQVHFSDSKPGQEKGMQTIETPKPRSPDNAPAGDDRNMLERQKRMADILQQENAERDAAKRRDDAAKAEHLHRCNQLRDLQSRTDGRPVYQLDANGERRYLDDKSQQELNTKVGKALSENCR